MVGQASVWSFRMFCCVHSCTQCTGATLTVIIKNSNCCCWRWTLMFDNTAVSSCWWDLQVNVKLFRIFNQSQITDGHSEGDLIHSSWEMDWTPSTSVIRTSWRVIEYRNCLSPKYWDSFLDYLFTAVLTVIKEIFVVKYFCSWLNPQKFITENYVNNK